MDTAETSQPDQDPTVTAEQLKTEGNTKYAAKDYHGAISAYSEAIRLAPTNAAYFANRAAAELMLGRYKDVISDCNAALAIDDKFVRALLRAGKAHLSLGNIRLATDMYNRVQELEPSNADARQGKEQIGVLEWKMERIRTSLDRQQYTDANSLVTSALETAPGSVDLQLIQARCQLEMGELEEALTTATMILREDPANPLALLLRGRVLYRKGSTENAVKHLQEALRLDPDYHEARKELRKIRTMVHLSSRLLQFTHNTV